MKNLINYSSINTQPQKELDDLVYLASQIFNTPISLISILEKDRQVFKSRIGLELDQSLKEDSFCHHTLDHPDQPLIVTDALSDKRFIKSRLVTGYPNIRFYAGIPLKNSKNEIFGTFCIIDKKPRVISESELKCLEILSRKAMFHLNSREIISNQQKVLKETSKKIINLERIETSLNKLNTISNYENALFELGFKQNSNRFFLHFLSEGIKNLYPDLNTSLEEIAAVYILRNLNPKQRFKIIRRFFNSLNSEKEVRFEYLKNLNGHKVWYRVIFSSEKKEADFWLVHGIVKNITYEKEYQSALKKILFDISHIIRKPITTIIGLSDLLNTSTDLQLDEKLEIVNLIALASKELEEYTVDLNSDYQDKMDNLIDY